MEVEIEYEDAPKDVEASLLERGGSKKQYERGGLRKVIYPPAIQKLKKANFFKSKKSLEDAIRKFESMGGPDQGKENRDSKRLNQRRSQKEFHPERRQRRRCMVLLARWMKDSF